MRNADATDCATRTRDADSRAHRLFEADALEDRVDAETAGDLAHALHCGIAAFAYGVGRAELSGERDPVGMAAEHDDLLGAEALRGDHTAQTDSPVADNGNFLSWTHLRRDGCMMASAHHV
jgi:hypothetical protein